MVDAKVLDRQRAIDRYKKGESPAAICEALGYSRRWFYNWLARADAGEPAWAVAHSRRPHTTPRQISATVEHAIVSARRALQRRTMFAGAQAIAWELKDRGIEPMPSVRTIGRVLARHALVTRAPGPYEPRGTRYPQLVAIAAGAVHQSDFVGPYSVRGCGRFYSLNSVDVVTSRCAVEPLQHRAAQATIDALWATWRRLGMPVYQQLDNEPVFYGTALRPRGLGPLLRLCLLQGIEPWFIPTGEPWRNGIIERFNGWWQQRGPLHTPLKTARALRTASLAFEARHNGQYRYSKLHGATPNAALTASGVVLRFPPTLEAPRAPLPRPEHGRYHVVRLIRSPGHFDLFGESFVMPAEAQYEYVRATIDVTRQRLRFYLDRRVIEERRYDLR